MNRRRVALMIGASAVYVLVVFFTRGAAQAPPPELGQGWLPEFTLTSRQLLQLAEATPADKFGWSPGPGVRSISEVYMHIALGNYFFLDSVGVKTGVDFAKLGKDPEKSVTAKADVVKFLRDSLDAVAKAYPSTDKQKKLQFFGKDSTADQVYLRLLLHDNEHMGQSIAYARMNSIVPPWSKAP